MRSPSARPWRALAVGPLMVGVLAGVVHVGPAQAAPSGAAAPAAAAAKPRPGTVEALRAEVVSSSNRIAAATAAYERGQAQLGLLLQRKVSTARSVEKLQRDARSAGDRVAALANSLYRNPVDPQLVAVLNGNVRSINDLLYVHTTFHQASAERSDDVALLTDQAVDTEALLTRQDEDAAAAIKLTAKLEDDLDRLQADAAATLVRLEAAMAEVRRREVAAAAAAARRAAAARNVDVFSLVGFGPLVLGASGGGAGCARPLPAGAINGFLPIDALCPLDGTRGHRLIGPAAAGFNRMSAAFAAVFGKPLCVTDSYRDYAGQVDVFRRKPFLAATPGRSQHGWGRALDLCDGIQSFGSPTHEWMRANAGSYGFLHPAWAQAGGSKPEAWHWEFAG